MAKQLTVTYDGKTLFDGDVITFNWSENEEGVKIDARTRLPVRASITDQFRRRAPGPLTPPVQRAAPVESPAVG